MDEVETTTPFEYIGYTFYFSVPDDIIETYIKGYLEAPFDITNQPVVSLAPYNRGSETFEAGEPIRSTYEGSQSYSFFSTGVDVQAELDPDTQEVITPGHSSSPIISPAVPRAGDFVFEFGDEDGITSSSDEAITISFPAAQKLAVGEVDGKDVLKGVPHIVPKLVIGSEGCPVAECVIGLEWKMVNMNEDGSWSDVSANTANLKIDSEEEEIKYDEKEAEGKTENEIDSEIETELLELAISDHRRFSVSIGSGDGELYKQYFKVNEGGSNPALAEGNVTVEDPIPINSGECSPSYMAIFYSIRGFNYGYTISGCLD